MLFLGVSLWSVSGHSGRCGKTTHAEGRCRRTYPFSSKTTVVRTPALSPRPVFPNEEVLVVEEGQGRGGMIRSADWPGLTEYGVIVDLRRECACLKNLANNCLLRSSLVLLVFWSPDLFALGKGCCKLFCYGNTNAVAPVHDGWSPKPIPARLLVSIIRPFLFSPLHHLYPPKSHCPLPLDNLTCLSTSSFSLE